MSTKTTTENNTSSVIPETKIPNNKVFRKADAILKDRVARLLLRKPGLNVERISRKLNVPGVQIQNILEVNENTLFFHDVMERLCSNGWIHIKTKLEQRGILLQEAFGYIELLLADEKLARSTLGEMGTAMRRYTPVLLPSDTTSGTAGWLQWRVNRWSHGDTDGEKIIASCKEAFPD